MANSGLSATDIAAHIQQALALPQPLGMNEKSTPVALLAPANLLLPILDTCYRHEALYFDQLACLTALDQGPEGGGLELIYTLNSIPYGHQLTVRTVLDRGTEEQLPEAPSVAHLWRTADWHEREAYDLVGVHFTNHPDLRRILLPHDWEGHPLRKDYQEQERYHGIRVAY